MLDEKNRSNLLSIKKFNIFVSVKQRVHAIILLLAFFGMFAHDMIPHHHHTRVINSEASHTTEGHHCHSDDLHSDPGHSIPAGALAESFPECPHSLHNCVNKNLDLGRSSENQLVSQKKIQKSIRNPKADLYLAFLRKAEIDFYPDKVPYVPLQFPGQDNTLRGPPSA